MPNLSVFIAGLALTFSLCAGDFKRFYPANAGERIVSITALPGGGLWLKSQAERGGGEISRVLVPSMHRVYRIPGGLTPVAAAAESGILMQQGETLFFRSVVKSGVFLSYDFTKNYPKKIILAESRGLRLIYRDNESSCEVDVSGEGFALKRECGSNPELSSEAHSFPVSGNEINLINNFSLEKDAFIFHPKDKPHEILSLEPAASGKTLIEWGQTAEIGWAVTSVSRNIPFAPPRRLIKIFSATDGTLLAKTQIEKEAQEKGLAVAFKLKPDSPDALAVITGAGMQWWAPKVENIDDWGEITLDLAAAKPAE